MSETGDEYGTDLYTTSIFLKDQLSKLNSLIDSNERSKVAPWTDWNLFTGACSPTLEKIKQLTFYPLLVQIEYPKYTSNSLTNKSQIVSRTIRISRILIIDNNIKEFLRVSRYTGK